MAVPPHASSVLDSAQDTVFGVSHARACYFVDSIAVAVKPLLNVPMVPVHMPDDGLTADSQALLRGKFDRKRGHTGFF
jgi:hypothetical protein